MTIEQTPSVDIKNFNYTSKWIESNPSRLVSIFFSTLNGVVRFPSSAWDRVKHFSDEESDLIDRVKSMAQSDFKVNFQEALSLLSVAVVSSRYKYMRQDILDILTKLDRTQQELFFEKVVEMGATTKRSELLSRLIQTELEGAKIGEGTAEGLTSDQIALLAKVVSLENCNALKQQVSRAIGCDNDKLRYLERVLKDFLDQDHPILKLSVMKDVSYETLCELYSWTNDQVEEAMGNEVKRTLANTLKVKDPSLHHMLYSVIYEINRFFIHLIDLVVLFSSKITMVGKIVKKNGDKIPDIVDVPVRLLICFVVLQYILSTTLAADVVAKYAIAGTAAASLGYGILALVVLFPTLSWLAMKYRPMPRTLNHVENLTQKVRDKKMDTIAGFIPKSRREKHNNFIDLNFRGCTKYVLHGGEGTEKDNYISALAVRLVQDDVHKELSDKELFVIDFSKITEIKDVLENFRKNFNNHKNDVIVCLKNVHNAWESKGREAIEQVELLGKEFPFVLMTTTSEKRLNCGLRDLEGFKNHPVSPLFPDEDLQKITEILKNYAEERAPKLDEISDDVLKHIVSESESVDDGLEQPGKAISLLEDIFREIGVIGDPELLASLEKESAQGITITESLTEKGKERDESGLSTSSSGLFTKETFQQVQIKENRQELMLRLKDQVRKVKKLWRLRKLKYALKRDAIDMALKMKCTDKKIQIQNKYTYLLIKRVFDPILTELISEAEKCTEIERSDKASLFMRPLIDEKCVNQVMKGLPQKKKISQISAEEGSSEVVIELNQEDIKEG